MRLGGSPPTTVMPHPLRWLVMGGDYEEGSTPANNNSVVHSGKILVVAGGL